MTVAAAVEFSIAESIAAASREKIETLHAELLEDGGRFATMS
jgi:hypothetical protein